jgi:hypothetical protein
MVRHQSKSQPTWADVKAKLMSFDHTGLVNLLRDLYAAQKDNQTFLHARFGLGEDVLKPYKQTIDRWLGLTSFATRTRLSHTLNGPSPITGRPLVNLPDSQS